MDASNCTDILSLPATVTPSPSSSPTVSKSPCKLIKGPKVNNNNNNNNNYHPQLARKAHRSGRHHRSSIINESDDSDGGSSSSSENDGENGSDDDNNQATPIVCNFDCYMSAALNQYVTTGNYSDLGSFMDVLPVTVTPRSPESSHSGFSSLTESPCPPSASPSIDNQDDDDDDGHHDQTNNNDDGKQSALSMEPLDSDYDTKSEMSTLSSSPINERDYPPLDEALLEEKFAKLGFSEYTIEPTPPAIKIDAETGQIIEQDGGGTDDDDKPSRAPFIRSTSLKSGKTPPTTPDRGKKVVRFADALGLEFEYVKLISQDEIPIVPRSAYQDLKLPREDSSKSSKSNKVCGQTVQSVAASSQRKISPSWTSAYNPNQRYTLVPEFLQPCASANFCDRVRTQMVCLENCVVSSGAGNISVTCVIRVLNIAFEKQVTVRHTLTEWQTWTDSLASYLPNSCDGWSDKFSVTFSIRSVSPGGSLMPGQRVLFAVRYVANNEEYWDNNMGLNYSLIFQSS